METRRWALPVALLVLLVVAFAMTNPDKEAFAATYADRLNSQVSAQAGLSGPIGQLVGGLTQSAIQGVLAAQATRQNLVVASIYTVPMAGPDLRVLGVLGHFITLEQPNMK